MNETTEHNESTAEAGRVDPVVSCYAANVGHALGEAVAALYFDDSSDYESALWVIIRDLGGQEAVDAMNKDVAAAYHKYAADRDCN